jgi:hypothetical protein
MGTAFGLLYALLIIFFAGRSVLSLSPLSLKDESYGVKLPAYFLSGSIVLSFFMLLLFFLRIQLSILNISAPFLLYAAYYLFRNYTDLLVELDAATGYVLGLFRAAFNRKNTLHTFIFLLISITVIVIFLQNFTIPIFIGDSYAHWFFKAKAIFVNRTIPADILTNMNFFYTRTDYPLLAPLNLAWIAMCTGRWSDTVTRTFFSFYFLSMIIFLYFSLKKHTDGRTALYGAFITSLIPNVMRESTNGYVDIIIAVLAMVSAVMLFNWFKNRTRSDYLLLSALFMGGAAWTKNDGIALFIAMALALIAYLLSNIKRNEIEPLSAAYDLLTYLAIGGVVFLPFKVFVAALGINNHMISGFDQLLSFPSNLWRVPYILNQFIYEFFLNTRIWLYFWIFFFLVLFIGRKWIFKSNAKYILLFMLLYSAFLFYVFMVFSLGSTVEGLTGNLEELERLLLQIAPTAVFVLMLGFSGEKLS